MLRVILHGACGQMGQALTQMIAQEPDMEVVAGVDPAAQEGGAFPLFASITYCDCPADVIIDFARAEAVDALLDYALEKKLPVVLCTTGLSEAQLARVEAVSEQTAILRSANMSLGVNTLLSLVEKAAAVFSGAGFDIEIVEKHHRKKLDAPSGTALALADAAALAKEKSTYVFDRSGRRQQRDPDEIGISAVRGGTIVGEHDVIFAGTDEVVTLSHTAYSRAVFARGALSAARFLAGRPAGLYSMRDVIEAAKG